MPDSALTKVEDALKAALEAYGDLSAYTVLTDQPVDVAIEEDQLPAILIRTVAYEFDQADEQNQTLHTATIEFEIVTKSPALVISRANHTAAGHILAAIAADRTLGGRLHDIQENDLAPADANGKDAGAASLQFIAEFFTARDDWFTIIGQSGLTF